MEEKSVQIDTKDVTLEWMRITSSVAHGELSPVTGAAMLQKLSDASPSDSEWLKLEMETIRRQFGLDIDEKIYDDTGTYWSKLNQIIEALLDERLEHDHALSLLEVLNVQYPTHSKRTSGLIDEIRSSPLYQILRDL